MSQFDPGNMESPLSGEDFINNKFEPWMGAVKTTHSGAGQPDYVVPGMIWLDTTGTPWILKIFQGSEDIIIGYLDISANKFILNSAAIEATPIGQTTPAAGTFTNLRYTGDLDYASDRELKEDITPVKGMLGLLMKLKPVSFRWKGFKNRLNLGFIAQDVREVLPDMVTETKTGTLSLHGMDLLAVLVSSVQELTARVEKLEGKKC